MAKCTTTTRITDKELIAQMVAIIFSVAVSYLMLPPHALTSQPETNVISFFPNVNSVVFVVTANMVVEYSRETGSKVQNMSELRNWSIQTTTNGQKMVILPITISGQQLTITTLQDV